MIKDELAADRVGLGRLGLGVRLRELRQGAGLTLADAASAAGLSVGYLSDVERGRRLPTLDALDRLCLASGTLAVHALAGVFPFGSAVPSVGLEPPPDGRSVGGSISGVGRRQGGAGQKPGKQ